MRPSSLLRTKLRLVRSRLDELTSSLWLHPNLRPCMPEVLLVLHDVACASVPLMDVAIAECRARAGDRIAEDFAVYLERHVKEEEGHDEWFRQDLEVLGVSRDVVVARIARPSVAQLIGAQHYWIRHAHPIALLGYLAVLEGNPPTIHGVEGIIERTRLPRAAFRTWLLHAKLDPGHLEEIDELFDTLPLEKMHTELVSVSALHTIHALEPLIGELRDMADRKAA